MSLLGAVHRVDFSLALRGIKDGRRYQRQGWNGQGMYVLRVERPESQFAILPPLRGEPTLEDMVRGVKMVYVPRGLDLMLRTVGGALALWTPSQADLLAEDWVEVPFEAPV